MVRSVVLLGSKRSHRAALTHRGASARGSETVAEHTTKSGTFARGPATAAIVVVGTEVDALAVAARLAAGARDDTLTIIATCASAARSFASRYAIAAVVQVTARIHAGAVARNERLLAAILALARLTRGGRVRRRRAHLAAAAAIGGVAG